MSVDHPPIPSVHAILPVTSIEAVEEVHAAVGGGVHRFDDHYAFVVRHGHELWHLAVVQDLDVEHNRSAVYVHVPDPDEVHAALVAGGLAPGPVRDEPWGMREFAIRDACNNLLRVGRDR